MNSLLFAAELPEQPPSSALSPKLEDTPELVAPKLEPIEFAEQQQQRDGELVAPQEKEEEGALAAGEVPALDFALAFRQEPGINQNLIPGEGLKVRREIVIV